MPSVCTLIHARAEHHHPVTIPWKQPDGIPTNSFNVQLQERYPVPGADAHAGALRLKEQVPACLPPSLCWCSSLSRSPPPRFLFCRSRQELLRSYLLCSIFQDIQRHLHIGLPFTFLPWDQTWREMPEIGHVLDQRKNQWHVSLPVCGPCGQSQVSPSEKTQGLAWEGPKNLILTLPSALDVQTSDELWGEEQNEPSPA